MKQKDIKYYIKCFEKLRRDYKKGGAPHKPILLISLIQSIQNKLINSNKIFITPELIGLFKSNWNNLVLTDHTCLFTLPFYHMRTEPFWELIPNSGCEIWVKSKSSMRSFSNLATAVKYAQIDFELFELLQNELDSKILLHVLLDKYFSDLKGNYKPLYTNYVDDIEDQIFNESHIEYKRRLQSLRNEIDNDAFQEEVYLRSNIFKRKIPQIYNDTCSISGLRIDAISNISMIDACHIVPFSESYNDTITNGIALCPNLHRAFDRGLVSINDHYEVIISDSFSEPYETNYSLKQFERKQILLPKDEKHFPSLESIKHHRNRFGF